MIDLRQMQSAFLLQRAVRLCYAKEQERWASIPRKEFGLFGDNNSCFYANVKSSVFKGLHLVHSHFWKTVLKTWLDLNKHDQSLSPSSLLWNNQFLKYQGNVLFFSDWIRGGILVVKDMCDSQGVISYREVCTKIGETPSRMLEYNVVAAAVRQYVAKVHEQDRFDIDFSHPPLFCGRQIFSCREFRSVLCSLSYSVPCASSFWKKQIRFRIK